MKKKTNKERRLEFFSVDSWKIRKENSVYGKAFKEATDKLALKKELTKIIMNFIGSSEDAELIDKLLFLEGIFKTKITIERHQNPII